MRKILICLLLIVMLAIAIPKSIADEEGMNSIDNVITITSEDNFISVNEDFSIQGNTNDSYDFLSVWIQTGAYDIDLLVNSDKPSSREEDGNTFLFNITSLGLLKEDEIEVMLSYKLEKDIVFTKTFLRDTNSISVKFDGDEIFTGTDLKTDTNIRLQLFEPAEPTLDLYIIVLIVMLFVIVILLTLYTFKKQKTVKTKETSSLSEELLNTKKALLMELLKDIEKKYRAKQISDDTYNKLKDKYKQEAVEAMKHLEDLKSKVK